MIYCVWYPSGGFGHFVNAVLSLYGDNFVRPSDKLTFSANGNSHNLSLTVPKYYHGARTGKINFLPDKNYSVLIDNGINDESTDFRLLFAESTIIKLCYTDNSWPIVARTMIEKAMVSSIEQQLPLTAWSVTADWAMREKYFLFLRDHPLRHAWKPELFEHSILIENLLEYDHLLAQIDSVGICLQDFRATHQEWKNANQKYFDPVLIADQYVNQQYHQPVTDIWTQAVIYYKIWCQYQVEVPHNDFKNFFENQTQYKNWLDDIV